MLGAGQNKYMDERVLVPKEPFNNLILSLLMSKLHVLYYPTLFLFWACATAPKAQTPTAAPAVAAATTPAPVAAGPVSWKAKLLDIGKVKKGDQKPMQFEFTNTSGGELKIYHVDACECTKVEFPRGIIPAGEKRVLDVVFDSEKKDASETISINVFFEKPSQPNEAPMVEVVQYRFELEK